MKKSAIALMTTLLVGCGSISAARTTCAIATKKPTLTVITSDDGGMCLDRDDTRALAHYIHDLEFCAAHAD